MITAYFVQHGIATAKDIDETRPLSDVGASEVHQIASALKNNNISIRKIIHSGKLRASQTAEIFSQVLEVNMVSETKGMSPNDEPVKLIEQITEDAVMYVGHLPNIQNVVSKLVSDTNKSVLKFQNAAIACVEINEDETHIKWFITPELCQ